jgi:hypothetical protein
MELNKMTLAPRTLQINRINVMWFLSVEVRKGAFCEYLTALPKQIIPRTSNERFLKAWYLLLDTKSEIGIFRVTWNSCRVSIGIGLYELLSVNNYINLKFLKMFKVAACPEPFAFPFVIQKYKYWKMQL